MIKVLTDSIESNQVLRSGLLKYYQDLLQLTLQCVDSVAVASAGVLAYFIIFGELSLNAQYLTAIGLVTLISTLMFPLFGVYRTWRGMRVMSEVKKVVFVWIAALMVGSVLTYALQSTKWQLVEGHYSISWLILWAVTGFILFTVSRLCLRSILHWMRENGHNTRRAIIIGAGDVGQSIVKNLLESPWTGIKVVAFYDDNEKLHGRSFHGIPVVGSIDAAVTRLKTTTATDSSFDGSKMNVVDHVWVSLPHSDEERIKEFLNTADQHNASVHFTPGKSSDAHSNSFDEFAGIPVVSLNAKPIVGMRRITKNLMDWGTALVCLFISAPALLLIAIAVKTTSAGPVLFKQRRYGLDGKEILVWKFRTMSVCEDFGANLQQASKNDPRVTRVGAFLRRTSLDELPQLVNVLQGRMSIVGPRPHAVAHNEFYRGLINGYMLRHKVKPGITGWAQINGWRGETDTLDKMENRVKFDLEYIRNWSLWLDIKILLLTVFKGFKNKNAY